MTRKYQLQIDTELGVQERRLNLLVTRLLDDLYWVMSYSRWQDDRFWPSFQAAFLRHHPNLTETALAKAAPSISNAIIFKGSADTRRTKPMRVACADLNVLDEIISDHAFVHGAQPTSIDAGIYGFIANIYFYDIETPLKRFVRSREKLERHCLAIYGMVRR